MKIKKNNFYKSSPKVVLLIALFLGGCSTQTDTILNRTYHQLNTKYNGLFYANQYLQEGIKKIENAHEDNYEQILPINQYGDLKLAQSAQSTFDNAIEKSKTAIQQHSMNIDGEEKNKLIDANYMIIGKSYFYKQEYAPAVNTFNYIIRKSNKENLKSDALIWNTRCQQKLGNKEAVRKNIRQLEEDYFLNKNQEAILNEIKAENSIIEGYYLEATEYLQRAVDQSNNKNKKTRMHYILGQLYLLLNEHSSALQEFNKVINKNPRYEMVFNAKLMRTKAYVANSKGFDELNKSLASMLKDSKNKEYKDQIHFALATLHLKNKDTLSTINSLKQSIQSSIFNSAQKIESHYMLANLFWENKKYLNSYYHCDSAYQLSSSKTSKYDEIKKMLRGAKKIANKYNIINYNDSIVALAQLPELERNQIIDNYIDALKKSEELSKKNSNERSPGGNFNSYEFNRQAQNSMNISAGGGWYFYNPSAMSLGYSEFLSRWGNRKLEDNWRRKNKNQILSNDDVNASINPDEPSDKEKYSREYYIEQLPLSDEEQLLLLSQIETAYYDLGIIFKEDVEDYSQSISVFSQLQKRFPQTSYKQLIYFDLYGIYILQGDTVSAEVFLNKIKNEYPESIYLTLLNGEEPQNKKLQDDKNTYLRAHNLYTEFSNESCLELKKLLSANMDNIFIAKIELLNAFCGAQKSDKKQFINVLEGIKNKYLENAITTQIDSIILILKGEIDFEKSSIYVNEFNDPHYFLLSINDVSVNLPETQAALSKFNSKNYKLDSLSTNNLLLTKQIQLLKVSSFENKQQAITYYELIKESIITKNVLNNNNIKAMVISQNNYGRLIKEKNINEYIKYFNEIYLLN
jgi:tetratricopeptide (TPR) repeat protein